VPLACDIRGLLTPDYGTDGRISKNAEQLHLVRYDERRTSHDEHEPTVRAVSRPLENPVFSWRVAPLFSVLARDLYKLSFR